MTDIIKISVPGEIKYIQAVKLAVSSLAATMSFDIEDIEDIKIATEEALKNITCHGNSNLTRECQITCLIDSNVLTIQIEDMCETHDIIKSCQPCMDCPNEGNLAVNIIKTLMDDVKTVSAAHGGKKIIMVKMNGNK